MQYEYLGKFESISELEDVFSVIEDVFYEQRANAYLPVLINEGSFIGEEKKDFYLKLVIKPHSAEIKKTWLLNNLTFGLPDPDSDEENNMFNLIVYRNYKNKQIYQLNPLLTNNEGYSEYGVAKGRYIEAYYNSEYHEKKGKPVFMMNEDENLSVLKELLTIYINDPNSNVYPKYELVAEFEYRNYNKHIKTDLQEIKSDQGFIDFNLNDQGIWIRGSVKIPLHLDDSKKERNIRVIDLETGDIRSHNPNNYTGDMEEGFAAFQIEVTKVLSEFYYFYDIELIDKKNIDTRILIDYFEDKIVFWEAEYNRLPKDIQDKIDGFNFVPETKDIISPAMYDMQLKADWNWADSLLPDKKLAYEIKHLYFERAIDRQLTFIYPERLNDFQKFILQIEQLTKIKLESFNQVTEVVLLIKIRDNLFNDLDLKSREIHDLYLKYCYAISKRLENVGE